MAKTVKQTKIVIYRHTSHEEWGFGVIVEETATKVYLAFEDGGKRAFVNLQRYRDLLVPMDLAPGAAEEVAAKIAKGAAKSSPKSAEKKSKKKVAPAVEEEAASEVVESDDGDDEQPSDDED